MPNPLENGNYNPNLVYIKKSQKECFCVYNKKILKQNSQSFRGEN